MTTDTPRVTPPPAGSAARPDTGLFSAPLAQVETQIGYSSDGLSIAEAGSGWRSTDRVGPETEVFEAPRGKDIDEQMAVDLRRMLRQAGFGPGGEAPAPIHISATTGAVSGELCPEIGLPAVPHLGSTE
jgi:hypothetical protein